MVYHFAAIFALLLLPYFAFYIIETLNNKKRFWLWLVFLLLVGFIFYCFYKIHELLQ